jgi:hypothetical protein
MADQSGFMAALLLGEIIGSGRRHHIRGARWLAARATRIAAPFTGRTIDAALLEEIMEAIEADVATMDQMVYD